MLHIPKKRSCPSLSLMIWTNIRRQPAGDKNGKMPSSSSTRASASQNVSLSKGYFLDCVGAAAAGLPRKILKNSEEEGSSTMTSLFLPKLAL